MPQIQCQELKRCSSSFLLLEAVCCIADSLCVPKLQEVANRLNEQNCRIFEGNNTMIDLQKKVSENKEDELKEKLCT